MGFTRLLGKERRIVAGFSALVAATLLAAGPASAALDDAARAEILQQRGAHALRTGDTEAALLKLYESLQLRPDHPETLALYARALLESGRPAEAEQVTQRLRRSNPNDPDVHFLLALTAYRQQDWIAARGHLEAARAAAPQDARVRLYLGRAYQELGEDQNAEIELQEAARLDPEFQGPAAYRLGLLHLQRSELRDAERFFEEVREIDPDSELARSAERYLQELRKRQPQRISLWARLGAAYDSNLTIAGADDQVDQSSVDGYRAVLETGLNARVFEWNGLSLRTGFTGYVSYHNKEHSFDIQQIRPWTSLSYQPLQQLAFDVRLTHERVWRNYHSFKAANFVQPAIRIMPAKGYLTRIFGEWEDRNYLDAFESIPTRDRDGQVRRLGIDQYFPIPNPFSEGLAYLRLGYRYRVEASDGHHFDSRSHKPLATIGFSLPWDMDISVDASWERRAYARESFFEAFREASGEGAVRAAPVFNGNGTAGECQIVFADPSTGTPFFENLGTCNTNSRLDRITQARVRLRKNIGNHVTLETFYRWVDWESQTQEFDFDRHIVGFAATFRR